MAKLSEEYDDKMREFVARLDREGYSEEFFEEISEYQRKEMRKFAEEYLTEVEGNPIKGACYEILRYLIEYSVSGSVVHYAETKEEAEEVREQLEEDFGNMMLDYPEVYEEINGKWAVDCMFGGNWCPYWDGWVDE